MAILTSVGVSAAQPEVARAARGPRTPRLADVDTSDTTASLI